MEEKRKNRKPSLCRAGRWTVMFVVGLWTIGISICAEAAEPLTVTRQLDKEELQGLKEPEPVYRDESGKSTVSPAGR